MNKTIKKLTIAVVALSLILLGVIGGVAAWLVAETGPVTNTFTYGNVSISLTETATTKATSDGAGGYKFEKVVPGDTLDKKAVVTVGADSEDCYVYVLIQTNLPDEITFTVGSDWHKVGDWTGPAGWTLYCYKNAAVSANTSATIFEQITFKGTLEKGDLQGRTNDLITVWAFAHQSANTDQTVADTAAKAWATDLTP